MKGFKQKLSDIKNENDLATLASEAIDDINHADSLPKKIEMLLDAGLTEYGLVDGEPWFWDLVYRETVYHLRAAQIILERIDILHIKYDDETIFEFLQSEIDFYDFNSEYRVRLFLLLGAYANSVDRLKISDNLYREMFDDEIHYSNSIDIMKDSRPLQLDYRIFKNTDFYDWCVEMEEQQDGYYGCWHMHIFDKKTKIKIAAYNC